MAIFIIYWCHMQYATCIVQRIGSAMSNVAPQVLYKYMGSRLDLTTLHAIRR